MVFKILIIMSIQSMLSTFLIAQQWIGNENPNDPIRRNGNVGIGLTFPNLIPDAKLHINGGSNINAEGGGYFIIGETFGSLASRNIVFDSNEIMARNFLVPSTLYLQKLGGGLVVHQSLGERERFTINSNGNVGIGTSDPQAKLHIRGGGDATLTGGGQIVLGNTELENMVLDWNEIMVRKGNVPAPLRLQPDGGQIFIHNNYNSENRIVINDLGNMGIGMTNPETKLHIRRGNEVTTNFGGLLTLGNTEVEHLVMDWDEIMVLNDDQPGILHLNADGGAVAVGARGLDTRINNSGAALAVNGGVVCEEVFVRLTSDWPDYVFDENYKLQSLEELEREIKNQKHLPGIPSQLEVKENGINVGELQSKLLKNVEELTLYMIELKKENNELKKRLTALENKSFNIEGD